MMYHRDQLFREDGDAKADGPEPLRQKKWAPEFMLKLD